MDIRLICLLVGFVAGGCTVIGIAVLWFIFNEEEV